MSNWPNSCRWFWRHSLWLSLPATLLLLIWLQQGVARYQQFETQIVAADNVALSEVMDYQAELMSRWAQVRSHGGMPALPPFVEQLDLFIAGSDLNALNRRLPDSGKAYKPINLSVGGQQMKGSMRYRGSHPRHWRGDKRSMRIKLKIGHSWQQMTQFDLLAPASPMLIDAALSYQLAHQMGLIASRVQLVWVNLNGEPHGLYQLVEPVSKQTLIHANLLPSTIYGGDVAKRDAYSGVENRLFGDARLWQLYSDNSSYADDQMGPLDLLIHLLNDSESQDRQLAALLDLDQFARFYLLNQLLLTPNVDAQHNWRLYYDQARGRFFPIVWDAEGWQADTPHPIAPHLLLTRLQRMPAYQLAMQRVVEQLRRDALSRTFRELAATQLAQLLPLIEQDPNNAIELRFLDRSAYQAAAGLLLQRIEHGLAQLERMAFALPDSESEPNLPVRWQGIQQIAGVQHIYHPVFISPGTRVQLAPGALLVFKARVEVEGTASAPVIFEPQLPEQPFAAVVLMGQGASGSRFRHCQMYGGSHFKNPLVNFSGMLSLSDVRDVNIEQCRFSRNQASDDMIYAAYSDVRLADVELEEAWGDALDLEVSSALIDRVVFRNSGAEGLDTMNSQVLVRHSLFEGSRDKAVSVGQRSAVRIEHSRFSQNRVAVLVKDESALRLSNSTLEANQMIGRLRFRNKRYHGGGVAFLYRCRVQDNQLAFDVDKHSRLFISDSYIRPYYQAPKKRVSIDRFSDARRPDEAVASALSWHAKEGRWFNTLDQRWPASLTAERGI